MPRNWNAQTNPACVGADSLTRDGENDAVDERWERMRKWLVGLMACALTFLAVTASAQDTQDIAAMRRAFERAQLYAQGFEVCWRVKKTPAQAVPLLQKANTLAKALPDGILTTKEEREATVLTLRCRVAPHKSAVQSALSRMRRVLGADGEMTLMLYGLVPGDTEIREEKLRELMESLGDVVRSTRRDKTRLALLGDAYQAAMQQRDGRVRVALARPRFMTEIVSDAT